MLVARALSVGHPGGEASPPLDLRLDAGEWIALSGPNGGGKSALLLTLAGLVPPRSGELLWDAQPLVGNPEARAATGIALQDAEPQLVTESAATEIALPLEHLGWPLGRIEQRVRQVLAEFGLSELADRPLARLSAGEQARLAVAAAVAAEPRLLLLDEPDSSLDTFWRARLREWIARWIGPDRAVVTVTQLPELWDAAARRLWLDAGGLREAASNAARTVDRDSVAGALANPGHPIPADDPLRVESSPPSPETRHGTAPLLEMEGVWFRHPDADAASWIVRGLTARLHAGETLWVRGANGSGKTTLLHLMAGLLDPTRGRVRLLPALSAVPEGRRFGILLASPEDQLVGETVLEDLLLGSNEPHAISRERALEALRGVGLSGESVAGRAPGELSAGERRRVAWAGLILLDCRLWILDEPSAGLDEPAVHDLRVAIKEFNKTGGAVVLATQDARLAPREPAKTCLGEGVHRC